MGGVHHLSHTAIVPYPPHTHATTHARTHTYTRAHTHAHQNRGEMGKKGTMHLSKGISCFSYCLFSVCVPTYVSVCPFVRLYVCMGVVCLCVFSCVYVRFYVYVCADAVASAGAGADACMCTCACVFVCASVRVSVSMCCVYVVFVICLLGGGVESRWQQA